MSGCVYLWTHIWTRLVTGTAWFLLWLGWTINRFLLWGLRQGFFFQNRMYDNVATSHSLFTTHSSLHTIKILSSLMEGKRGSSLGSVWAVKSWDLWLKPFSVWRGRLGVQWKNSQVHWFYSDSPDQGECVLFKISGK